MSTRKQTVMIAHWQAEAAWRIVSVAQSFHGVVILAMAQFISCMNMYISNVVRVKNIGSPPSTYGGHNPVTSRSCSVNAHKQLTRPNKAGIRNSGSIHQRKLKYATFGKNGKPIALLFGQNWLF